MKNLFYFCLIVSLLISCSKTKENDTIVEKIISVEEVDEDSVDNIFSKYSIVPLESKKECLIKNVDKLVVTSKCVYVLDRYPTPNLFSFAHDGRFLRKICQQGHSKSEVPYIFDICANEKGDSVFVLQYDCVKVYSDKGKYLTTIGLNSDMHCEKFNRIKDTFVCSSNYSGVQNLVSICNTDF